MRNSIALDDSQSSTAFAAELSICFVYCTASGTRWFGFNRDRLFDDLTFDFTEQLQDQHVLDAVGWEPDALPKLLVRD